MQLTFRGLVLLLAGTIWLALLPLGPPWTIVALGWWLLTLALLLADWRLAPQRTDWSLARRHDERLSLAAPNRIEVAVQLRRPAAPFAQIERPVPIWLRDDFPGEFLLVENKQSSDAPIVQESTPAQTESAPGESPRTHEAAHVISARVAPKYGHTIVYDLWPPRRGDYTFGDLYLRWTSPLRLWRRQARFDAAEQVKVYPNLLDVKKYDLFLRRNRLAEIGARRTRLIGSGNEFERLREYVPDDEYRRIDWKATARRAKPIATEYEVERSQNIIALVDIGRMMRSAIAINGSGARDAAALPDKHISTSLPNATAHTAAHLIRDVAEPALYAAKLDFVLNAVLLLAYVATRKGDKVGLMTFADGAQHWLSPRGGKRQFHHMLETLYAVEAKPVEPNYHEAMSYFAAKHSKRSLVILFTDFSGGASTNALVAQMARLRRQHVPLLVTIGEPALYATANETPTDSASLHRRTVAERLLQERRATLEALQHRGVFTLDVAASELNISLIDRYLQLRTRLAG